MRHRMCSNGGTTYKSREKGAHCRRLMAWPRATSCTLLATRLRFQCTDTPRPPPWGTLHPRSTPRSSPSARFFAEPRQTSNRILVLEQVPIQFFFPFHVQPAGRHFAPFPSSPDDCLFFAVFSTLGSRDFACIPISSWGTY